MWSLSFGAKIWGYHQHPPAPTSTHQHQHQHQQRSRRNRPKMISEALPLASVVALLAGAASWACWRTFGSTAPAALPAKPPPPAEAAQRRKVGLRRGFYGKASKKGRKKSAGAVGAGSGGAESGGAGPGATAEAAPAITANERVAHKLMLESAGAQHGERVASAAEQQLVQTWKKAYWDRFAELLAESPPDLSMLVANIKDLRQRLIELTPHREDLALEAQEKIDLGLIAQMVEHGAFGVAELSGVLEYVTASLRRLEAPANNQATDDWMADMATQLAELPEAEIFATLLPQAFKYLSDKIDAIGHGAARAKSDILKSFVSEHGAEYERQHFAARVQSSSAANLKTFVSAWVSEQQDSGPRRAQLTPRALLNGMVLKLVASSTALQTVQQTLPETLALDVQALQRVQDSIQSVTLTAGWLHACASCATSSASASAGTRLKGLSTQGLSVIRATIASELQSLNDPQQPQIACEGGASPDKNSFRTPLDRIVHCIKNSLEEELSKLDLAFGDKEQRMFSLLVETMPAETNKLYSLMKQRVVTALALLLEQSNNDGDGQAEMSEGRAWMEKNGLELVAQDVESVAAELMPLLRHQLRVHAQLYQSLLTAVATRGDAPNTPPASDAVPGSAAASSSDSDDDLFRRVAHA